MSKRFVIDCYGIVDTWREGNTCEEKKLSWSELCDTLNELDEIARNREDYEEVVRLNNKIRMLEATVMSLEQELREIAKRTKKWL